MIHSATGALSDGATSANTLCQRRICQHLRHSTEYVPASDNSHTMCFQEPRPHRGNEAEQPADGRLRLAVCQKPGPPITAHLRHPKPRTNTLLAGHEPATAGCLDDNHQCPRSTCNNKPERTFSKGGFNFFWFFLHFMSLVELLLSNIKVLKKKIITRFKSTLSCPLSVRCTGW